MSIIGSGHDRRATLQTAISKIENNARRPPPEGYLKPGAVMIDRGESTMFVARRIGSTESHVAVALNIEPLLRRYGVTRMETLMVNLLAALFAAGMTFWAIGWSREETIKRAAAEPSKPRLVA